jgi:hypothetical protein
MAVAVLLPFLDVKDLLNLGSTSKDVRAFFAEKVRFDTLFMKYNRRDRVVDEDRKEELIALNEIKDLSKVLEKLATNILLSETPKLIEGSYAKMQYKRFNKETKCKELLSPAAERESMNAGFDNESYLQRRDLNRDDSPFAGMGLRTMYLNTCCWMNPWSEVSGISRKAKSLDIYMYHMFTQRTRLNNTLKVWLTSESKHSNYQKLMKASEGDKPTSPWTLIHQERFESPLAKSNPDKFVRQKLLTYELKLEVLDLAKTADCDLIVYVEVYAASGDWKSDWYFEAVSVEEKF